MRITGEVDSPSGYFGVLEEVCEVDLIELAELGQLDDVDPSITGLALGHEGHVQAELVGDFLLSRFNSLPRSPQGSDRSTVRSCVV